MRSTGVLDPLDRTAALSHGTILFVDDEELLRDLGKIYLERAGYLVLLADSAAEALEQVRAHDGSIDLLATDVNLSGTTGPMLAKQLRESFPCVQLIYMSGYPHYVCSQAIPFSEAGYLQKPFSLDELVALVGRMLALHD